MSSRGFTNSSLAESRARRALAALSTNDPPTTPRRPSSLATGVANRTSGPGRPTTEASKTLTTSTKSKVAGPSAATSTGKTTRSLTTKPTGNDDKFEFDTWKKYINEEEKKNSKAEETKLTRRQRKRIQWKKIQEDRLKQKPPSKTKSSWGEVPDLILELIFQYLPLKDKYNASQVCAQWSRTIFRKSIWQNFIVTDSFMTRSRLNFAGQFYEDVLDHAKASNALNKLIGKARRLWFLPKKNLHVVCGFQTMMIRWCGHYGELPNIQSFTYIFPCDFARKSNEVDIYGTGGSILEEMKKLLLNLTGLKRLELIDLELENIDACHVLDEVSSACDTRITTLKIINISRHPFEMLAVATFVNLQNIYISPHNIGPDLVLCFGDMKHLRNVVLHVNAFTDSIIIPVDPSTWKQCRKSNPYLRVHLCSEGKRSKEIVFQEGAPVRSIVYESSYAKVSSFTIFSAVELYRSDIECVAYCRLPRYHMPKKFHDRGDGAFLQLVQRCPYIHTLMIRDRISSATVLLLAYHGKNLHYFYVRRNAIVLKCDWPKNPDWDSTFYEWLRISSRSYDALEREVSMMLGFRWYALNDKQFKLTNINFTAAYYFDGYERQQWGDD